VKLLRVGAVGRERACVLVDGVVRDVSGEVADYDAAFFASGGLTTLRELVDGPLTASRWSTGESGWVPRSGGPARSCASG